ncbi:ABC transporter ATP-binding protein [Deinococcus radiotolerans]|uniref:ABC transporter permease n=1 Tax=Deinococcus radiotolerans TaxID=1309407 RepID=A0ABQ2FRF6_9DEIO|nr:ABC transporter ATP-binding protein [Deinococcus radiotolerans]GGL19322.1 ABC transporter permease [Deinococcus radiotolerans]
MDEPPTGRPVQVFKEVAHVLPRVVRLLIRAHRKGLLAALAGTAALGLLPAGIASIAKVMVDTLAAGAGPTLNLWLLIAAELLLVTLSVGLGHVLDLTRTYLGEHVQHVLRMDVNEHAAHLDLAFFEQPENHDTLEKARRELGYRPVLLTMAVLGGVQNLVTISGFVAIVLAFQPFLLLALVIAAIPVLLVAQQSSLLTFRTYDFLTPEGRRAAYVDELLTQEGAAKELRLFGLSRRLLAQSRAYTQHALDVRLQAARRNLTRFAWADLFSVGLQYVALAFVVYRAATGSISLGDFTLLIAALAAVRQNLTQVVSNFGDVLEHALLLTDLDRFLGVRPVIVAPAEPLPAPVTVHRSLRFERASFTYPGATRAVFTDFNLELRAGEATALVGVNGAGKTTLVKLLTRLYDPGSGRITLDGTDIRSYDPEHYRELFGVILQDFTRYQFSAEENVVLARPNDPADPLKLGEAAQRAGLTPLVNALPEGWGTFLGRQFQHRGQELSGGQWQKVALARALYRDAPILILDEPTAALDAEAEAELFKRYRELTQDRLSLLITHRFNTVRFADRIVVIEEGQILEDGTHAALMALRGRYHDMFTAQAQAYDVTSSAAEMSSQLETAHPSGGGAS